MQNEKINEAILLIGKAYFSTNNTVERYNMLHEVEKAIKSCRDLTISVTDLQELIEKENLETETASNIEKIKKILRSYTHNTVNITPSTTIDEIANVGELDDLDMFDFVMNVEMELDIDIGAVYSHTTIGDILSLVSK